MDVDYNDINERLAQGKPPLAKICSLTKDNCYLNQCMFNPTGEDDGCLLLQFLIERLK